MNELTGRPALPLSGSDNGVLIKDADGLRIFASSRPDEEARRDVAFIVATVNGHDMLCRRVREAEANVQELLDILSRLQSEHCDLIERERVLETKLAAVKDDVGTIMMLVRPEPHEHEYIAARRRLQAWLWPHTKEVQP